MRRRLENGMKQLALTLLPNRLLYWLWHRRRKGRPRTGDNNALDLRIIPVQDGVCLEVYWNTNPLGPGPSASLFVLDEEVLRVDCFGGKTGHMHINPVQANLLLAWETTPRYFFPPDTIEGHIDRCLFELTTNTPAALQTNQLARVRSFPLRETSLIDASLEMKTNMYELLEKHGVQSRLPAHHEHE